MHSVDIKKIISTEPFRPVILRLSNGAEYPVNEPRDLGMARSGRVLFYFGGDDWVMIDAASIVEVISLNGNKGDLYPPGEEN